MITAKKSPFEQAVSLLGALKQPRFANLPRRLTDSVQEIRLRVGRPITLECSPDYAQKRVVLAGSPVTSDEIAECIREFCGYSIHSHEKQLREGWITLIGGHRAGFCGTAVLKDGRVTSIHAVSSVNLRIARQFFGCAEDLYANMDGDLTGLLIIGKPLSAKTTVLRDLCRLLSADCKIALIDERGELAAVRDGVPSLFVGENTDVLDNFPKAEGVMTALRSLSPEYIICDEIGWREAEELTACVNCGVKLILTAHCGSLREAYESKRIRSLLSAGGISHIALLGSGKNIGKVEFYGTNKLFEDSGGGVRGNFGDGGGALFFLPAEKARGAVEGTDTNTCRDDAFDQIPRLAR